MAIVVFNRRGMQLTEGKGEITALLVPSVDQVVQYRDTGMTAADIQQRMGKSAGAPLWREESGNTTVYGLLPQPLYQSRQGVKVWLAADFAPNDAEAFFFMFQQRWLVHGVKETDDEGRKSWRATVLNHEPEEIFQVVADQAADLLLSGTSQNITVAVDGDLVAYGRLKEMLAPLQLVPVPFSMLKPSPRAKLLYRHRDFTLLMLISVFFVMLMLGAALVWLVINRLELARVNSVITGVRTQISEIQINDNLGEVSNPDDILKQMQKPFTQQPSAVLDAAARLGAVFGTLQKVDFQLQSVASTADPNTANTSAIPPEQRMVMMQLSKVNQKLLVNQEEIARRVLPQMTWVRSLARMGENSPDEAHLQAIIQIDSPPGTALPSSTAITTPILADVESSATQSVPPAVSANPVGSGLPASPTGTVKNISMTAISAHAVSGMLPVPANPGATK